MSIEDIIANLSPKLRKSITTGNTIPLTKFVETPSPALNMALGGGLPLGRQVLVWGNKSAGKSALCMQTVGIAQKSGYTCAWIDAEMSYDPVWSSRLGVDPDSLLVSQARTINEMVDTSIELMNAGVDVIVVDSISALLPAIYFEKDSSNLKQLEDTKQIGAESRDFSNAWKMINYANNKVKPTLFIIISQSRTNLGGYIASQQPQGGASTKFYSSVILKLFSSESESQSIKGKISNGDKIFDTSIGRKVNWDIQFSKTGPAFQSGCYNFYFRGDHVGVDTCYDLVTLAEERGVIEHSGAWYTVGEQRIQGKDKVVELVRADDSLRDNIIRLINGEV